MYITADYLNIHQGNARYLFYLLTEDYIEEQKNIKEQFAPLMNRFSRNISQNILVTPYEKDASKTLNQVIEKLGDNFKEKIAKTPSLLILDKSLESFNPEKDQHIFIHFREFIDDYGNIKIFPIKELLELLAEWSLHEDTEGLFQLFKEYQNKKNKKELATKVYDSLELTPNIAGIGIDLKSAINLLIKPFSKKD
ncbi:MAG: hypothetical protein Q4A62_07420 [Eikenella sp.]|nr:hypothetical protein [Eikenella sp.]